MAVPRKYRELGDFHSYYSGERTAPYLTIFIGGNHEASNHLFDLYYGGWVAPNIYYLGAANVVRYGPLRVSGLSGIWKGYNYRNPHYEQVPYSEDDKRSVYHVREIDVRKLLQIRTQVDIGLSHDWPRGVEWKGDWRGLFRFKKHLESDARKNDLGSPAAKYVMDHLRPPHWFSAHLHCKYSATIQASEKAVGASKATNPKSAPSTQITNGLSTNVDEIDIDLESDSEGATKSTEPTVAAIGPHVPEELRARLPDSFKAPSTSTSATLTSSIDNRTTKFLALDKCLPNRRFLQLLEVEPTGTSQVDPNPSPGPFGLSYDQEWLAITRVFAKELQLGRGAAVVKDRGAAHYRPMIEAEEEWVEKNLVAKDMMQIPDNFVQTAPPQSSSKGERKTPEQHHNPQTTAHCELLGIPYPFTSIK